MVDETVPPIKILGMPRVLDLLREIGHAMKMSEIEFCASCKIYLSAHFHVQFPDIEDS